jgi:1-acyl-sn-glycerol-3-phosphate acyltransferase
VGLQRVGFWKHIYFNSHYEAGSMEDHVDIEALARFITDEILTSLKIPPQRWAGRTLGSLFRFPAHRFAEVAGTFDQYVQDFGFREAALRILPRFARGFEVRNVQNIPQEGPLLITSNHPGTCDSLVIAANIPRSDLKIVATGVPFMQGIRHAAGNLIYTTRDVHERMMVVRQVIRHLKDGGAVLIFPTGRIDPDPALSSEANQELEKWSPSLELILRHVPEATVLLTIVSGVLSPKWRFNPIVRLTGDDHMQRSVAEFAQVIFQMIFPNSAKVEPHVTFADPLTTAELTSGQKGLLEEMVERTRQLLQIHLVEETRLLPACS